MYLSHKVSTTAKVLIAFVLLIGCDNQSYVDPVIIRNSDIGTETQVATDPDSFNFGPILARGQTLRHEFTLTNESNRSIRILNSTTYTPCCSSIEKLPDIIAPEGRSQVGIRFSPGYGTGRKALRFAVETDSETAPIKNFVALAELFAACEVTSIDKMETRLPVGQSGTQTYRITCRRTETDGLESPDGIALNPRLAATFKGPAIEHVYPNGIIETSLDIEVTLPAISTLGVKNEELLLTWKKGHSFHLAIKWDVVPRIHVTPLALIIPNKQNTTKSVVLTQTYDPIKFRIISVESPLLAERVQVSPIQQSSHVITLRIDPSRGQSGKAANIRIFTDHPAQSLVTVSVLVMDETTQEDGLQ